MTIKTIIPIYSGDKYSQDQLLADGSVSIPRDRSSGIINKLPEEAPITKLLHSEVRYEVTDHCNASCIMCPKDKHEHAREHGIMNQEAVSYTHLRAHETDSYLVCRLLLEKK